MPAAPAPRRRAEVLAATPTLFDRDGELDNAATGKLLAHLAGRVDGVFIAGTTGEFPALSRAERRTLAEAAVAAFGPDRVVVHAGAASTREAVAILRDAAALGARRFAALTPYYLPSDAAAVHRHFAAIADAARETGSALYGYLFEERSGVEIGPDDFAAIAAQTGVAGAKLSGTAANNFARYRHALPPAAELWSGADTDLANVVHAGGAGVVSGLSSAFPEPFMALADAVAADDANAESAAQTRADEVLRALAGTPQGIKLALHHLGIGSPDMRMPHPEVLPAARTLIAELAAAART
ncbi:dihydrodipicolinate synthase family protein [Saccharopolyspora mangrovi]|uniref:Dihydrodipicolinate synthase family protein n=1 Tax=Saccharopolyspora mangrovi TaxID=3082379 RepID=A0ABU6AET4_9PSEU|nr:dihydrodipicolinate synthase family protein [Saccharopolyspora sp. S2-29]MEB3370056.1 dihydrodipicolinate synthase family protein [Saccharopolyspora sp. S2-29]